ncbi:hypothetical protein SAMN04488540_102265 [Ferrimonas sediminum]|uniref:Uncharacterized protein n=1 Tax=Ferrimonas sediminum TaxID=718193 RepID=A0A1G8M4L0_9GAMM|nr:hypothetical protein [Ferrimonas sediminum]SDI62882.1 hypothetical protein SAMN04488540_102265 [Ferrimonas sediminum]
MTIRPWQTVLTGWVLGVVAMALMLPLLMLTHELSQWLPATGVYALSVALDAALAYLPVWLVLAWLSFRLGTPEASLWLLVGAATLSYLILPAWVGTHWHLAAWIWSQPSALLAQVLGVGLGGWLSRRG